MSPNTGNFVHELVVMAKAFEELPQVQAQLDAANTQIEDYAKQVQRLEMKLMDAYNETQNTLANLRKTEEAREDAELRFLEADDRTDKALAFVRSLMGNAQGLINAIEPPKPEPQVEPTTQPLDQCEDPFHQSNTSNTPEGFTLEHGGFGTTNDGTSVQTNLADPGPAIGDAFTESYQDQVASGVPFKEIYNPESASASEVAPTDPIASSLAGDGPLPDNATPTLSAETRADASSQEPTPVDDVGYHNEPTSLRIGGWQAWDAWCNRMNARYGSGNWPKRDDYTTA